MTILDNEYIFDGTFGLERETLRVDKNGFLAQTPHPFPDDMYMGRDFCENQLELITPVCETTQALIETVEELDYRARVRLSENDEYLWMNSNPPHIESEADIPIARFSGKDRFKRVYRENLEKRYGKRLMLYSGIHFNFSFSEEFLHSICTGEYKTFKNSIYFKLHKHLSQYSWLLIFLFAASPVYDLSLDGDGLSGSGFDGYASKRGGDKGYWNKFVPILDYSSLDKYIESINEYVKNGDLFAATELYLPVRIKPRGENSMESLAENGINHIELRMFDLNPLSPIGVVREDLDFAHYLIIYLLSLEDFDFTPNLQRAAIKNHKAASRFYPETIDNRPADSAALFVLQNMQSFFRGTKAEENINLQIEKIVTGKRRCVEVKNRFGSDFHNEMLRRITQYPIKPEFDKPSQL